MVGTFEDRWNAFNNDEQVKELRRLLIEGNQNEKLAADMHLAWFKAGWLAASRINFPPNPAPSSE